MPEARRRRHEILRTVAKDPLPVKDIRQLRDMAVALNGPAKPYARTSDRVVANVLARDGSLQDVIYQVK